METLYLLLLSLLIAVLLFLFIWLKPDLAKKYWAYILGGLATIFAAVILLTQRKQPASSPDPEMKEKEDKLKADLVVAHEKAEAEIVLAVKEEDVIQEEVAAISRMTDEQERLKKLADLFNSTRKQR